MDAGGGAVVGGVLILTETQSGILIENLSRRVHPGEGVRTVSGVGNVLRPLGDYALRGTDGFRTLCKLCVTPQKCTNLNRIAMSGKFIEVRHPSPIPIIRYFRAGTNSCAIGWMLVGGWNGIPNCISMKWCGGK